MNVITPIKILHNINIRATNLKNNCNAILLYNIVYYAANGTNKL